MNRASLYGLVVMAVGASSCTQEAVRPNLLLILTDDQGWGDFGFNGNDVLQTPILDSLQSQSAHLTSFYVSPLSASTRAGILTGRDHLRSGVKGVTRSAENMASDENTIAEVLGDAGYRTGCFGKWHNGAYYPQDARGQGFDEFVGFNGGHIANYFSTNLQHNGVTKPSEGYITDYLTDKAIEFMESNGDDPFFCYLPYNAPHAPIQVPEEFYAKYNHLQTTPTDITAGVYAMCENIDYNVGRILKSLEQNRELDNTIVIFTTDNGPKSPRYNGQMRGVKGHLYEGGIKTPCLIFWQGRIASAQIDTTLSYIDLMPTILGLCGIDYTALPSKEMDGVDFSALLRGDEDKELTKELNERYLFMHKSPSEVILSENEATIFNSRYKLVHRHKGRYELYDKLADPTESEDILVTEPDIADAMRSVLHSWFDSAKADHIKNEERLAKVGLLDEVIVLPSHEASTEMHSMRYNANQWGWAGDWFVNISDKDRVWWSLEAASEGEYEVSLQYALQKGYKASVSLNGDEPSQLPHFNTIKIESPDIVPRGVAFEQSWALHPIARVTLERGEHRLELKFAGNGIDMLEIKGIAIKKL